MNGINHVLVISKNTGLLEVSLLTSKRKGCVAIFNNDCTQIHKYLLNVLPLNNFNICVQIYHSYSFIYSFVFFVLLECA